jgi:hypothetical protein
MDAPETAPLPLRRSSLAAEAAAESSALPGSLPACQRCAALGRPRGVSKTALREGAVPEGTDDATWTDWPQRGICKGAYKCGGGV